MNRYQITYDQYDRGPSTLVNAAFEAPNDKAALLIAHPCISWGCNRFEPDYIDEDELNDLKAATEQDLIEAIYTCNGDGCDFLFLLKNETTGKVIFQSDSCESDDDDEDVDVYGEEMFEDLI